MTIDSRLHQIQQEIEICRKEARRVGLQGVERRCLESIERLGEIRRELRESK